MQKTLSMKLLEICANSVESARNAARGGAKRIELCQNLNEGGTTPSYAAISYCVKNLSLATFVLIRPRTGDFRYSEAEYEVIKNDVAVCRELGVAGVVVGFLNEDLSVDKAKTAEIVRLASPMQVTFHRAIDVTTDWQQAMDDIIGCGCHRILTSGCAPTAMEGLDTLKKMVAHARGRIIILPASGIGSHNAETIITSLGVDEIHASAKHEVHSASHFPPGRKLDDSNTKHTETNLLEVERITQLLNRL